MFNNFEDNLEKTLVHHPLVFTTSVADQDDDDLGAKMADNMKFIVCEEV